MPSTYSKKLRTMVFAGAGASAGLGMPTTSQFTKLLVNKWPQARTLIEQCRQYYIKASNLRKGKALIDSEELRDWLLKLEQEAQILDSLFTTPPYNMDKQFQVPARAYAFINEIRIRLDEMIRSMYGEVKPTAAFNHYGAFFDILQQFDITSLPFFTTNYDLGLESLGDYQKFKWRIETGIERRGTGSVLNINRFNRRSYRKPTINLYKLHGSTDWWFNREKNQMEFVRFGITPPPDYDELLIYPTREKFEQVSKQPFSLFYDKLRTHLSYKATHTCIVIGYSFRDIKINELFEPAIKRGLRLLVLDVNVNNITQQLQEAFPTINLERQVGVEPIDFGRWDIGNTTRLKRILEQVEV